jgi:UDP-N-acetylmuramoyl-tripeptide--D-alanyl-D-alanine ligase
MSDSALWTVDAMAAAMRARRAGPLPEQVTGLSIDTRGIARGDAFFAIKGDSRDGHEFVPAALKAGAALAVVAEDQSAALPNDAPLLLVADVLDALRDLARQARARSQAKIVAVTGSVGKTGTKEALRLALARDGETHASAASYNNHWGVPLSLARCPQSARFAVFELGMNHAGEIEPLSRLVRPHVAIVTAVEPVHLEYLGSVEAIADAKAEIFRGLESRGAAVLNRDSPHYARLHQRATEAGVERIVSFGENDKADVQLLKYSLQPDCSTVRVRVFDTDVAYKIGAPGRHLVQNSLAVLAAVSLVGADLALAALALAELKPSAGRGARTMLDVRTGTALLIDESYNANPASMRAAIAVLGGAKVERQGRRIAVLGDMLELGPNSGALHAGLAEAVIANSVDLVYCSGPQMRHLWDALPPNCRGFYAESSAGLETELLGEIRPDDAIMIKGSLGSKMGILVKALERRYPRSKALEDAPVQG